MPLVDIIVCPISIPINTKITEIDYLCDTNIFFSLTYVSQSF